MVLLVTSYYITVFYSSFSYFIPRPSIYFFFFFNDTATTEIYTLSLHDALPISALAFSEVAAIQANGNSANTNKSVSGSHRPTSRRDQVSSPTISRSPHVRAHHQQHDPEHRHHGQRGGRAHAQLTAAHADRVGVGGHQVGGVGRAASGQHVDELEVEEREDDRERGDDEDHRHEQGQRDVPEPRPRPGAVDRGALHQLVGDRLQPRQDRDAEERQPAPRVDEDHGHHGEGRIAQPRRALVLLDQVEEHQQPVEHPHARIEDPLPGHRAEHRRHDERQQQQRPRHALQLEVLVHHERHAQPAHELEHGGRRGEAEGVPHRLPEDGVVPEVDEVAQADEGGRLGHRTLDEAQVDAVAERVAEERQQEQQGRREHQPAEDGLPLQPLA